jgi:DNA-binding LacI/PurR family transcriptional regulator
MALGALRALHEAGRRIPQDMSVVGFDDIPEAPYFIPPLTTIRQDFDEMGRSGLRLLLDAIESPGGPPTHREVVPELVVRASSGAPPV